MFWTPLPPPKKMSGYGLAENLILSCRSVELYFIYYILLYVACREFFRYSFWTLTITELPGVPPYCKTPHWWFWISSVKFFFSFVFHLRYLFTTIKLPYTAEVCSGIFNRGEGGYIILSYNIVGRWHSASVTFML